MKYSDTQHTLPAVQFPTVGEAEQETLTLTIVFHPDTARIGEIAQLPRLTRGKPWVLGRSAPLFGCDGSLVGPLADPHISRRALIFERRNATLSISRPSGSSRCRMRHGDMADCFEPSAEQLRLGLPLLLGHSIVLMLRLDIGRPANASCPPGTEHLLGSSARLATLRERIARTAAGDLDVLITGETGSGKELAARAVHSASLRARKPIVTINMAAIPQELAAAALFGSEKGAFTGADKGHVGYFRQADGGTLFLDEIGATPAAVQPQLLRALQQREIQVLGGGIERVDVRVIAATDADLDDPRQGFNAALRFRLGASELEMPALREHPEDIGLLLLRCLFDAASCTATVRLPTADTAQNITAAWAQIFFLFAGYHWPGNVRQLQNFAKQLLIGEECLPRLTAAMRAALGVNSAGGGETTATKMPHSGAQSRRRRLADIPKDEFERVMRENDFELKRVSRVLGVSRASVYRRIERGSDYRLAQQVPAWEIEAVLASVDGDLVAAARELRVSAAGLRSCMNKLGDSSYGI